MSWFLWLAAFVILIGIEAATMALTTIWFAGGALVAFFLALSGIGSNIQLGVFFLVSLLLLFGTRPFAIRYVNKNTVKTNVEGIVGRKARITAAVNNDLATGAAVVAGQEWTARSENGELFEEGTMVIVKAIQGVKLIVGRIEEEE